MKTIKFNDIPEIVFNSNDEAFTAMEMAMGRILRLGSRPTQPGDTDQYKVSKRLFEAAAIYLKAHNSF